MAERSSQKVYLFNCDGTYNLDIVEKFLLEVDEKHGLDISTEKLNFRLNSMAELCENTIPRLQIDIAIFVVHAHESRLSINEENAGIGYAKIYKALLEATEGNGLNRLDLLANAHTGTTFYLHKGDKVLIVIGGDDQYKDEDEEKRTVISRWVRRKVASQFKEEYLDGRKSFIFSWNKQHREIHEEALLHYFDPSKKGKKFEYQPKPVPLPKRDEYDVTSQAAGGTQKEFVVEDDRKPLVAIDENETRGRTSSNRERQTQELRSEQGEARYGTITDYPTDTVLLETIMRYGEISYQVPDVVKRVDEWQAPDAEKAHLKEEYGSTPMAKVTFTFKGNGEIECVAKEVPWWRRCVICVVSCAVACWVGFTRCMRGTWVWICDFVRRRCGCRC